MATGRYVADYRGRPADLLRDLAAMARSDRLRRVWESNLRRSFTR